MSTGDEKQKKKMNGIVKNLILILMVVALAVIPLIAVKNAEFGGSDNQGVAAITEINKDYKPWFSPVWKPPGSEIESLLFSVQSAIGAGVIGFALGYLKGRKKRDDTDKV